MVALSNIILLVSGSVESSETKLLGLEVFRQLEVRNCVIRAFDLLT